MDYPYGYCGMPCALCTRYRTDGSSRCPGCSENGYYTDTCKVHHCCSGKELKNCGCCDTFPCVRVSKMGEFSNLKTDNAKIKNCMEIKASGFEPWYENYIERAELLTEAIEKYNNGRMKRYLCELFIRQDMDTLKNIMCLAKNLTGDIKEKANGFKSIAESETTKSKARRE